MNLDKTLIDLCTTPINSMLLWYMLCQYLCYYSSVNNVSKLKTAVRLISVVYQFVISTFLFEYYSLFYSM